jgi:hypothetical protein
MPTEQKYFLPDDTATNATDVFVEIPVDDPVLMHYRVGDIEVKVAGKENRQKFMAAVASVILHHDERDPEGTKERMRKYGITYNRAPKTCMENGQ